LLLNVPHKPPSIAGEAAECAGPTVGGTGPLDALVDRNQVGVCHDWRTLPAWMRKFSTSKLRSAWTETIAAP
jgi:hypothetical protein